MAVIIRQPRPIGDEVREVPVYLSTRPVGEAQREQARRLDDELSARMAKVTEEVRAGGWLELKGRPGVVRLWWEVGRRIGAFVHDVDVGPEQDRQFVWRAMYDHAPELVPGKIGARADRLLNSHFYYCYLLGRYDWARVQAFGDWTSWVEVFDSERIRRDPRIADWMTERATAGSPEWTAFMKGNRMGWFRPLAKAIRARFDNRDTTGLGAGELYGELDEVFASLIRRDPSTQPPSTGQIWQAG